jgi:hypothetical protein
MRSEVEASLPPSKNPLTPSSFNGSLRDVIHLAQEATSCRYSPLSGCQRSYPQ